MEERFIDVVGAGTGQEKGALRHFGQRVAVEFFIGAETCRDIAPLFDEGGRVEDDEIVSKVGRFEEFEKVGLDKPMAGKPVESEVFF